MAAKTNAVGLRKITKPVISTDVMGNRNVEIRAVGAWVQPAYSVPAEGVAAAEQEEARIRQTQAEKEAKLKRFREDVKNRVRLMEKARKQKELEKSFTAVEQEQIVLQQSAFSENIVPRKDSCLIRKHGTHAIKQIRPPSSYEGNMRNTEKAEEQAFIDHTEEVHKVTRQARSRLVSKQIITDDVISDGLPGGVWKVSVSRDLPLRSSNENRDEDVEKENEDSEDEDKDKENESTDPLDKVVQFNLQPTFHEIKQRKPRCKSAHASLGGQSHRRKPVPDIYAGVHKEEQKKQQKLQQATYRRLFMDIEREQVKENIRRKEHHKRIQKLKLEKEEERRNEEEMSLRSVEPRDPLTGETSLEALQREIEEHRHVVQVIRENEERLRKVKEMERFVEALKQQLKEKMDKRGVELPPLCCCGMTLWDTNPDTCANNCVFYRNPRGYAKALQSLLMANEIS
ncbi:golgin subfamily A member 6-like protein 22 [Saccostrea cucullata]|uniref:golgin subfamily A member 6-like protein 22 n=1 Tax=Saccostrea cuccullata TaxID=36930 RepID=UPI002ED31809